MTSSREHLADTRVALLVRKYPVVAFSTLALALSWGLWLPFLVTRSQVTMLHILPGAFGPALAGITVKWMRGESIRKWLWNGLNWRVDKRWYLAVIGIPVIAGVALGLILYASTGRFAIDQLQRTLTMYPLVLLMMATLGGGQEEFGWRGVALPLLEERFDAFTASIVIGSIWATWHLPLFAFGVDGYGGRSFLHYTILVIGFSVIFTWLYNNADGSILLAMLLHGGINTASGLGGAFVVSPAESGVPILLAYGLPIWTIAGALLARYGRRTLSMNPVDRDNTVPQVG